MQLLQRGQIRRVVNCMDRVEGVTVVDAAKLVILAGSSIFLTGWAIASCVGWVLMCGVELWLCTVCWDSFATERSSDGNK